MNKRIIKSILSRKFKDFLSSITDEKVRKLVRENTIITGGSIVSLLTKEKVNDFDCYFTNLETTEAVARYYVDQFNKLHIGKCNVRTEPPQVIIKGDRVRISIKSAGIVSENTNESQYQYFERQPIEDGEDYVANIIMNNLQGADELDGDALEEGKTKYRPVFLTDNAITLSQGMQLIIRFYGDPAEIHENFDFVHCMNYWISGDNKLVLKPEALESILTKQLWYSNSKYPICAFIRCRKFIRRGWHINAGQMLKICMQISQLDLTDIKVLEDQLVGVDSAYFTQLIDALKDKQSKDPNFHVNLPYVTSIIDRIF